MIIIHFVSVYEMNIFSVNLELLKCYPFDLNRRRALQDPESIEESVYSESSAGDVTHKLDARFWQKPGSQDRLDTGKL